MQWYQMFEYAIGHWLQKATEHMMGCVLCRLSFDAGCFINLACCSIQVDRPAIQLRVADRVRILKHFHAPIKRP